MSCTLIDIFTSFPVQERLDTQSDRVEATNREPTSLENTDASDVSFKPKRCNYFYLIILVFAVHICYFACSVIYVFAINLCFDVKGYCSLCMIFDVYI